MKIKEVIHLTGLTDRAIRLYISHGLVSPKCQRSYSGRNQYSFTTEDVEQLQKIALLRKASFSLEQIKKMQQGGSAVGMVLRECLTQKWRAQKFEQSVVEVLEGLCAESALSLDLVYQRFSKCFQEQDVLSEEVHDEPRWKSFLKQLGCAVVGILVPVLALALLFWAIFAFSDDGKVYETTWTSDYLKIEGNYNNEKPEAFIRSFFPGQIEDSFSEIVYHYKAKKGDTYAYECYLEFVIKDPADYQNFITQHIDKEACVTFQYDEQFQEQCISNVLSLDKPDGREAALSIEHAKFGKILFSDQQQRIIFVAIGMFDGGGTNTVELGHFFSRFQIDPWLYSQSAYASEFYQEKGITNAQLHHYY